jgi:hypothetical protein
MDGLWRIFHAPALIEITAAGGRLGAADVAGENLYKQPGRKPSTQHRST